MPVVLGANAGSFGRLSAFLARLGTEEKDVRCCFRNCRVLTLVPKDGISYRYNFLQKHNGDFTPFAIPMYGLLSPEDEKEIAEIVAEKAGKRR